VPAEVGGSGQAPIQRLRAGHYVTPEGIEIVQIPHGSEDSGCWLLRYGDENYYSDRYATLRDARWDAWLDPREADLIGAPSAEAQALLRPEGPA
jgi:hypothetical protein